MTYTLFRIVTFSAVMGIGNATLSGATELTAVPHKISVQSAPAHIRPSPFAPVIAELPQGKIVDRFQCTTVMATVWCRIVVDEGSLWVKSETIEPVTVP